ncbi:MAG: ShlB/FhaC/HecB family hemolysin secretion/activation protein [Candidatus Omnitrophica bacterium]|nr:ShlB/FhaC/HecB family hemolysin secretion/activation protein [Candidatus Omnitrophota bacterium]
MLTYVILYLMFQKSSCLLLSSSIAFLFFFCFAQNARAVDISAQTATRDLIYQADNTLLKKTPKGPSSIEKKPQVVDNEKQPEAVPETQGPKFAIREIILNGNKIFTAQELASCMDLAGKHQLSLGDLKKIARNITLFYRLHGYITSRAWVPPQKIKNKTVIIKILEGKIGTIGVEGNHYFSSSIYINGLRLKTGEVLRYSDLEAALYQLNQKPDLQVKAFLAAGRYPGSSDILLEAQEKNPLHVYYEYNNRGTKLTHRDRHGIGILHNNITGHADTLNNEFYWTYENAFIGDYINYHLPFDKIQAAFSLEMGYIETRLIKNFKSSNVRGKSWVVIPQLSKTLVEKSQLLLEAIAALEIKDSKTAIGGEAFSFDRMRVVKLGPRLTLRDSLGRTVLEAQAHIGLPRFLDGSPSNDAQASRPNAGGRFTYYTVSLGRIQRLPFSSYLLVRADTQLTHDNLTSLEQYRAGGAFSVRGYPEGDSAGDGGYSWSTEIGVPVPVIPRDWRVLNTDTKWYDAVRLVGFIDGAQTHIRELTSQETVKNRSLLGTGVGLRINIDPNFSLQADLGFPIADKSTDDNKKQLHIGATAKF